jgi:uncharacterized protein (UPF0332 family)
MDPRDFQVLASELVRGSRASEYRTAVSRAYYAVHNVGFEILTEFGFNIRKNFSGHADVWDRLSNSGDSDLEKIGSQLSNLHGQRIHADYRMDKREVESSKTAQAIVETARKMIQILDGSRSDTKRNQIISAIKKWEEKTNQ